MGLIINDFIVFVVRRYHKTKFRNEIKNNSINNEFSALLAFLSALDSYFISHAYFTTLVRGASVQIVFGFEVSDFEQFYQVIVSVGGNILL